MLSNQQIRQFTTDGYTMADDFFDDREVRAMQAEIARFQREGLLRNVATDGDGKTHSSTKANLQLCPMYNKSNLFRALAFQPKVIESVEQLIGSPIILQLDQVFFKPARHGAGTSWHQDDHYFGITDPLRGTAMWIAVHDATVANGALHVIPGQFRDMLHHDRDPMSDHHKRCWPDESRAVPVELKAGGVVFFCYRTPHCTLANQTDGARAGAAFHFLHVDYARQTSRGDLLDDNRKDRPYLSGPQSTGGQREYGVCVAGTWDAEVDKAIRTAVPA